MADIVSGEARVGNSVLEAETRCLLIVCPRNGEMTHVPCLKFLFLNLTHGQDTKSVLFSSTSSAPLSA